MKKCKDMLDKFNDLDTTEDRQAYFNSLSTIDGLRLWAASWIQAVFLLIQLVHEERRLYGKIKRLKKHAAHILKKRSDDARQR
jgi:hypothetical protein